MKGFWIQLLKALNPQDHSLPFQFCMDFQQQLEEDRFAEKLVFSDKAMFHVCGKVNHHNIRILSMENAHAAVEHVCDSPKVNVSFAVLATFYHDCSPVVKPASTPWRLSLKQTWRDSLCIDMLLSAVSVLVVVLFGSSGGTYELLCISW
jgi:hypothetical protein